MSDNQTILRSQAREFTILRVPELYGNNFGSLIIHPHQNRFAEVVF